ncbi:MAG: cyclic nucleotide-binding domain-containing protein, partial [Hyphomicrobiales bacterium]|nr:cyclic nucleotide-binding domain-containing protein [Hyphomicrobiales bacterium]
MAESVRMDPLRPNARRTADPDGVKRGIIGAHAFFDGLPESDVAAVAEKSRFESVASGEMLFAKGDPGLGMIAVVSGTVRIASLALDGREATLNTIGAGEIFGEIALLDGRPRTASAIAVGPCDLLVLRRDDFMPLMRERPAI